MFEKMRRAKQELEQSETEQILLHNTSGVLALVDTDGYPYSVPLSYVYTNGKIYFHSAVAGHKIEAIKNCDKATFCIIDKDEVQPEKYTTFYKSVIVFGKISLVNDQEETMVAIRALGEKYYPQHDTELQQEIDRFINKLVILRMDIEHATGKQAKELLS